MSFRSFRTCQGRSCLLSDGVSSKTSTPYLPLQPFAPLPWLCLQPLRL